HRILLWYGMGYANNIYGKINNSFTDANYSFGTAIEAKYAYFFDPNWGVSLGAGLSYYAAKGTLNMEGIIPHYNDPDFDINNEGRYYDLYYKTDNLVEKQRVWALEIPLQAHFEHFFDHTYGIFASLGLRGYFPFLSARSSFSEGDLTLFGYEAFHNDWHTDPPRFGRQDIKNATSAKAALRWSLDAIADFGGLLRLSPVYDLYVGLYGGYGFIDVLPKAANKKDFITPEQNRLFSANSLLASNMSEKWNRWQIGVKVGLHIKPCKIGKTAKEKSLRAAQKEFYERLPEYMSNSGQTVVVRDTIHVVYVYNNPPENNTFTPNEQASISALVGLFSNSKILFDLNSDVPKIENTSFFSEAAKILEKESSLSLLIEGYTCDLGTEQHNRELATRRANAIRNLFIAEGVNPSQIQVAAYTANDPQSRVNITDTGREEHRAVVFRIVKR
ncbi:MAG: OmpA family protein, partial [Bacteroidales bacterium]|nr:OmpA family protein [Bacteroidales bacterium]